MSTEKNSSSSAPKSRHLGLFSSIGVAAVGLVAIGLIYLSRNVPAQIDFTDNNFYSLTQGTKDILKGIDTEVKATFFVSDDKELPAQLLSRVKDLETTLRQYENATPKGLLKIRKVDPRPNTEGGEQAALAGVQAQEGLVMTLSVECLDKRENVDFLPILDRDELYEYEISRAIANVLKGNAKKKIGVMSSMPLLGSMGPMMGGQQRPWLFFQQLKQDYDVVTIEMTADKIDDKLDALMIVHPAGLTDTAQYAIDQFVLQGKPVVLMLDSHSIVAKMTQQRQNPQMAMMGGGGETSSNAPKLLNAWGYSYDSSQVVADMLYKTQLSGNRTSSAFLTLGADALNTGDPVTGGLSNMLFVFSGTFAGKPAAGLNEDILLHSSPENEMVSPLEAENSEQAIQEKFVSSKKEKILGLRLTGKFKSAFPDGKPKAADTPDEEGNSDDDKKDEKQDETPALKEMVEGKNGVVILLADTDFLYDNFSVRMLGNMALPLNGNLPFGLNMVDQIAGDTRLLQVRSRGSSRKPFTKIKEIETAANEKIKGAITDLQKKADEANARLEQLQAAKDPQAREFISPEQQNEISEFRKQQADASRQIRELKKSARKEIDSTLASMKLWNILGTPLLVAVIGLVVFIIRRKTTSAQ